MNYNILYFAFVSNKLGGVEQKILAQFDALKAIHPATYLYLVSTFKPGLALEKEISKREDLIVLVNTIVKNPLKRRKEKFDLIVNSLKNYLPHNTIIYFRYPNADFIFCRFLKENSSYKIITEHQEIENTFKKGKFNGNYLRNTFELIWGRKVRKLLAGFVGVTPEITAYELSIAKQPNKPALTNGNGIHVEKYPVRQPMLEKPNEIKILFVGAGYRTHGLHRLLKSMANFKKEHQDAKYDIILNVAGDSNEMLYNIELVKELGLQQNVHFLGQCEREALNQLYDWADVAVGSLGIHRKGLSYTSELKAREYYSRGIPFFWSTMDEDLPKDNPYVLNLEQMSTLSTWMR